MTNLGRPSNYKPKITYDMLPQLRACRNMNQSSFAKLIGIPQGVLSQIESGLKPISEYYEKAIREGLAKKRVSVQEIEHVQEIIKIKKQRGYK
ncbi:transcriptional regulator [Priestia megaterium]|uniref:helix-turn-helix domain-containing protein n=1 Tax=Priestia megaterium TaxID=1404 RepID=UPI000BF3BF98|nr:helix-turn-helix transcriptional regulator [Priestia megaterium]PFP44843.1 transcriptional regulator [Priestia megaterium]